MASEVLTVGHFDVYFGGKSRMYPFLEVVGLYIEHLVRKADLVPEQCYVYMGLLSVKKLFRVLPGIFCQID